MDEQRLQDIKDLLSKSEIGQEAVKLQAVELLKLIDVSPRGEIRFVVIAMGTWKGGLALWHLMVHRDGRVEIFNQAVLIE